MLVELLNMLIYYLCTTNYKLSLYTMFFLKLSQSMKDQSLATIDSNLIDTGYFLEEIVNDSQKNKCLQTFRDCQQIISWLKKFTKS